MPSASSRLNSRPHDADSTRAHAHAAARHRATGRSADVIRAIDAPFDAQDPDHLEACRQLWRAAWPEVDECRAA